LTGIAGLGILISTNMWSKRCATLVKEYRTALISVAVTGKIDVREKIN